MDGYWSRITSVLGDISNFMPQPYSLILSGLAFAARTTEQRTVTLDEVLLLEAELKYIAGFHVMVIVVAVFGASVTFPLILTSIAEPSNPDNLQTVQILLSVSWTLFVIAALLACLSAGESYGRGYVKAVREAVNNANDARAKAEELENAQSEAELRNILQRFEAEIRSAQPKRETIVSLLEALKTTQRSIEDVEISAKEYRRMEKLHHGQAVMERLEAARLALEIETHIGNARLSEARQQAMEIHEKAAEDAENKAMEAADRAVETEQKIPGFSEEVRNTIKNLIPNAEAYVDALGRLDIVQPSQNSMDGFNSVLVVVALIGGALICLGVVIFMYARVVGVIAITFIALSVLALSGVSLRPSVELWFRAITRKMK